MAFLRRPSKPLSLALRSEDAVDGIDDALSTFDSVIDRLEASAAKLDAVYVDTVDAIEELETVQEEAAEQAYSARRTARKLRDLIGSE